MTEPFKYASGEEIKVGDIVREHAAAAQTDRVECVLLPGTRAAEDYYCPDGGIMLEISGTIYPCGSEGWEDIEFIARGPEQNT